MNAPTQAPTKAPVISSSFGCALPPGTRSYSLITNGNAAIGAHDIYRPIIVGGTLSDGSPYESGNIAQYFSGKSYIKSFSGNVAQMFNNFPNGGYTIISSYNDAPSNVSWDHFKWLAQNAVNSNLGGYKVVVFTQGGTYNTYSVNPSGQGEDNGKTLMIFNTSSDITLTKTSDGRQFGPSVLAPFSKVTLLGDAGYVDGFIVAREFTDSGGNRGSLQLHGDGYAGPIQCRY